MSAETIPTEWYFITPPQDVSWSKDSATKSIDTYGTNNPYLNYGTTKLRTLTLGNCLVEGFSNAMQVEDNIRAIETCMQMIVEEGSGYAAPFCWYAYAGGKSYGVFIIKSVKVKEEMRDMTGNATRAYVDIELQEVAQYQVGSGIDITSTAIQGSLSQEGELALSSQAASQDAAVAAKSTDTYNVSGVTYDAATGRPVEGQSLAGEVHGDSPTAPKPTSVNPLDAQKAQKGL